MDGSGRTGHGRTRRSVLAATVATAAGLSGCLVRGENSRDLSGQITIDGSDTVFPFTAAVAEEFQWRNNRVRIPISGSGTGGGFRRFCAGETDVQNASRQILPDEEDRCAESGVEWLELPLLRDGIALWVHPDNDWCDCLRQDELAAMWESGSAVDTWADVRDGWPDREIEFYGRDTASGTFDYFTEHVTGEIGDIRSDYAASSDTNVVVRGVRGNRDAIGFGGAGYYYENEDDLKLIGVENGEGECVLPTTESIESDEYQPLARTMYVYFDVSQLHRPEVRAFARFFFAEVDDDVPGSTVADADDDVTWAQWAARRVGYYAAPDETIEESYRKLEAAIEEWS